MALSSHCSGAAESAQLVQEVQVVMLMGCKLACSKQLYSLCSHWLSGELTVSMNRCHPRAAQPAKQAVHSMLSQPDAISGNCQNSVPYGQYINRMLGAVPMQLPLLQGCWRLGWRLRSTQ